MEATTGQMEGETNMMPTVQGCHPPCLILSMSQCSPAPSQAKDGVARPEGMLSGWLALRLSPHFLKVCSRLTPKTSRSIHASLPAFASLPQDLLRSWKSALFCHARPAIKPVFATMNAGHVHVQGRRRTPYPAHGGWNERGPWVVSWVLRSRVAQTTPDLEVMPPN